MEPANFVDKVAQKITSLGLNAPAILLLEAHKPVAFLGSQLLLVAEPGLNLFLPEALTRNTADLLANPEQLESLIRKLEKRPPAAALGDR